jgi:antirestriction protein ArdC
LAGKTKAGDPIFVQVPVRYALGINRSMSLEAKYVTMAHELGHLYCGHLGTANTKWWPDRQGLSHKAEEFEAESAAFLVCGRLGIDNPSEQYLSGYAENDGDIPPISLECVMRAAGLIETMSANRR